MLTKQRKEINALLGCDEEADLVGGIIDYIDEKQKTRDEVLKTMLKANKSTITDASIDYIFKTIDEEVK